MLFFVHTYASGTYIANMTVDIMKNFCNSLQRDLQPEKKKSVIDEITKLSMHRDPHKLSELLDVIEIVLGFLASAGGMGDQTLQHYITKTLTMQRTHIPKV